MVEVVTPPTQCFWNVPSFTSRVCDVPDCVDDLSEHLAITQTMYSEKSRLETYSNWPSRCSQNPQTLAKAGLYYLGKDDKVECPFCFGVLKNWLFKDDPMKEHLSHFPTCRYVLGEYVGNIPLPEKNYEIDAVRSNNEFDLDYKREDIRLSSFSKWPTECEQSPVSLARAGFYHLPSDEKPDRVKCAYCNGRLYNWNKGDDPWIEHARCLPKCPYIQLCIGEQLVSELVAQHEKEISEKKQKQRDNGEQILEVNEVQNVLEMGFHLSSVKQVLSDLRTKGHQNPTTHQLVEALLEFDNNDARKRQSLVNDVRIRTYVGHQTRFSSEAVSEFNYTNTRMSREADQRTSGNLHMTTVTRSRPQFLRSTVNKELTREDFSQYVNCRCGHGCSPCVKPLDTHPNWLTTIAQ